VWKAELVALSAHPDYVSLQIDAALDIHAKAVAYEGEVDVRQLRAYLMLFDVNVQNGGLYPEDVDEFHAWAKKTPKADATARLEKMLELRLRHVRSKYVADVRARKKAIIHGAARCTATSATCPPSTATTGTGPTAKSAAGIVEYGHEAHFSRRGPAFRRLRRLRQDVSVA